MFIRLATYEQALPELFVLRGSMLQRRGAVVVARIDCESAKDGGQ